MARRHVHAPHLAIAALAVGLLTSCSAEPEHVAPAAPASPSLPATPDVPQPEPRLLHSQRDPVHRGLTMLVSRFVRYAVGDIDTFPHRATVTVAVGGAAAPAIENLGDRIHDRSIWITCPEGAETYGASDCPVDVLSPITSAVVNDALITFSDTYRPVVCAPARAGRPPSGAIVVFRPEKRWRTCASDYALTLVADRQGRLRHLDLTLSEP